MSDASQVRSGRARWIWLVVAALAAAVGIFAAWYLALPRYDICPAIYPAPPGCGGRFRVPGATLWTVVLVVATGLTAVAVLVRRLPAWVAPTAAAVTVILAIASHFSVLNWG